MPDAPPPPPFRVGLGHDAHRCVPHAGDNGDDPPLVLGGVAVPADYSLVGHSDADVLLHAVTDAVLGACGGGDIGDLFPNTAAENAGRDSVEFLAAAVDRAAAAGWRVGNCDCTVHAERPKLAPYKPAIAARLAELLRCGAVSVKAKTGEAVGPVGRGEAVYADAAVLLFRDAA